LSLKIEEEKQELKTEYTRNSTDAFRVVKKQRMCFKSLIRLPSLNT